MSAYGYSAYDSGFLYRNKIIPSTAHNYYGISLFTPLNVNPFTAVARDYTTIMLQWTQPQGSIQEFRLLANRYGFPVDENDGNILIDSTVFPGGLYADQDVIPGAYHYYGIYLLQAGIWVRAGFASCLAPFNYASGDRMFRLLPVYHQEVADAELTQESADDTTLAQFLSITGWGMDYLRTQYDMLARHLNDPMAIPLGDLFNLAAELGVPYQPEIPPGLMRKAVANWTHVCQERGTPGGLAEHVTLLTGYPVDLQSGSNLMLENDQAAPYSQQPAAWTASLAYKVGELVSYQDYIYTCILIGGVGTPPTGTTGANTYWQVVQNTTDAASTLANPNTVGGISTWEAIYPALDSGGSFSSPSGTLVGTIGLPDPLNSVLWQHNAFSVFNKAGSTQDVMLRSVSRVTSDMTGTNTNILPDQIQVVKDGIPVPRLTHALNTWDNTVRYPTDAIVEYDGMLFQALRASTGATPPSVGTPVNANFTFEAGVSPWTATNNAAITQSATQAFQGSDSMKVTPDGSTAGPGAKSEAIAVIPGAAYTCSAWAFIPAGWSTTEVFLTWFDPFGAAISVVNSGVVNVAANTWTQLTIGATAPASAATAVITVQLNGTPSAATVSYWDLAGLSCQQTPEWCLLSPDNRMRLMASAYAAQALTVGADQTVQVQPFIEWYDESGKVISSNGQYRLLPRVASAGTPGIVPNLTFDSFTTGQLNYLNGRLADTQDQQWSTLAGAWAISGFSGGTAYPAAAGTRSMAVVTGLATGVWLGVTLASAPQAGQDEGIVFRATNSSNYWRAGMTSLRKIVAGSPTTAGTYSTACVTGDRLTVNLSGSTITVYRNGAQVLSVTDAFNSGATLHGIVVETA